MSLESSPSREYVTSEQTRAKMRQYYNEKIKNNPQALEKMRERGRENFQKLRDDPVRYAAYLKRKSERYHERKQKKQMQQAEVLLAATEIVAFDARKQLKEQSNVRKHHSSSTNEAVNSRNAANSNQSRRVSSNSGSGEYSTSSIVLGRRAEAARRICAEEGIQAQSVREVIVEINGVRFIYIKE